MISKAATSKDVDTYIAGFPAPTRKLLQQVRATIKKTAPAAEEVISYGMPAFKQQGMLVFFAGYQHHIGFYPTATGIEFFKKDLAAYKWSKGAVQFPLDQPLPLALITRMVQFKLKENLAKQQLKAKKTK